MSTKKSYRQDDPDQSQRFIDTAKKLGIDERKEVLDKVIKAIKPTTADSGAKTR